jgi:hypothetical protein
MSQIVDGSQFSYNDYSQQDSQSGMYVDNYTNYRTNTLPAIQEEEPFYGNQQQPNNKQKQLQKLEVLSQEIDFIQSNMESQETDQGVVFLKDNLANNKVVQKHQLIANYQNNLQPNARTPTKHNSNQVHEFNENFNGQVRKVLDMYDQFKMAFCNNIEEAKRKFILNTDQIRDFVNIDSEKILDSEEKNREIDMKMMLVYRELQNVMNEFNNFN